MKLKTRYNHIKGCLYLLLLLALPLFSMGNDKNKLFEQGNTYYAKGQYQQAVTAYQQILNGGYQSAIVYYNLGNAYFKLDDIPSALLYYEKAHKLVPNDEDISANIRFVNSKTTDKLEPIPEFFVTKWWHGFILIFSISTLAILSVLFLLAGSLFLILYLFTNSESLKRSAFYTAVTILIMGLVTLFMGNRQVNYFDTHHQAIIFGSSVTVKSTPDAAAMPLFVIHEGTKVNVLQTNSNWIEIELPNGNAGWIATSDAKAI
jgi:tetratricopeptide (TPR) repeat protein